MNRRIPGDGATVPPSLNDQDALVRQVRRRLLQLTPPPFDFASEGGLRRISAVLFLLGWDRENGEVQLILNKRSRRVRQPGDLCCPGGGVAPGIDSLLAKGLRLPATPLAGWRSAARWRRNRRTDYAKLALLLATGLREGFEEMRLNPFGVDFLGPMPVHRLVLFKRAIYPLVGWVRQQQRFRPNWEVERVVRIPLAAFFDARNYARYHVVINGRDERTSTLPSREMPCFRHRRNGRDELLWGVTYRITETFLAAAFDFVPPPPSSLPRIDRSLGRRYMKGARGP